MTTTPVYTQHELNQRMKVFQTHTKLGQLITVEGVNELLHLFDETTDTFPKITDYVEEEWKSQHIYDPTISVSSKIYGYVNSKTKKMKNINEMNPSLHLQIQQNGKDLVHLSIHLIIDRINPSETGIVHFRKNEYLTKKYKSRINKSNHYALLKVHPISSSLHFSIEQGYHSKGLTPQNVAMEALIQQQMNVMVTVLNSIFDEISPRYIGHKKNIADIHPLIDETVNAINHKNTYTERPDKHVMMISSINVQTPETLVQRVNRKTARKKLSRKRSKNNHNPSTPIHNMNVPSYALTNNNINNTL